ncbi:MAG: DNA polymerase III delta prime subunit [Pseudolabrys sp.]|jgi:DNA polymerase-3 subunit delta'|nr:DNA polymerase III delta prime subunit [Pseudolabrys sp.]
MSKDNDSDVPHPRETFALFGHADAERILLDSYKTGRMPHAWLLGGPRSIGKATLAYRLARFVLAHPDPGAPAVQAAASLAIDQDNPVARRVAGESHSDLLVLERVIGDTGKLNRSIRVEQVRQTVGFFGSTAGEGGWRIAIVDAIDELQSEGENALLKVLEEPPPRSLLLLVSHAPGRILPTIRSRCRQLLLRPLSPSDVASAAALAAGSAAAGPALIEAAAAADGSVERALSLMGGSALAVRERALALLGQLPNPDPQALHALGDAMSGVDPAPLETFVDTVNGWLSQRLHQQSGETGQAARVARAWEQINVAAREAETYNLERKPLVFGVFRLLAEAARG